MKRALLGVAAVFAIVIGTSDPVQAALREVRVGNFYFEDATVDDGKVEATVGDQLKFVVQDGGPGTPHTVEVDELNIHSGSIGSGKTYTTPPLQVAGTFKLYCKPHEAKGHTTTLVVFDAGQPSPSPTTTPHPTTTNRTGGSATTTTAAPKPGASATTTVKTVEGSAGVTTTTPGVAPSGGAGNAGNDVATSDTFASGTGEASVDELANAPIVPGSLESVLGRRPASRGPWTCSVRMALASMPPMLLVAAFAVRRFASRGDFKGV